MSFQHTFPSGWGFSVIGFGGGHEIAVRKNDEWHFDNPIGTFASLTEKEVEGLINSISEWESDETFDGEWEGKEKLFSHIESIMDRWDEEDE